MAKIKVGIIYGGRNNEHEVSLRSAASVFRKLDRSKFEPKTIYIDKKGVYHWADVPESFTQSDKASLPLANTAPEVVLLSCPHQNEQGKPIGVFAFLDPAFKGRKETVEVIMPMVHGTNCEDGILQGLFESAAVPYTGSGVLGSAICMDKEVAKRLAEHAGLPVVPYRVAYAWDSESKLQALLNEVEKAFHFPIFVKAASEGSSVGVYKVKSREEFFPKLKEAFTFDRKVLIEKAIPAREIEFSVMENLDRSQLPHISKPAEIIPTHEFYTYDSKYNDENGAIFKIPAEISPALTQELSALAQKIFLILECEGYSRIDLFLDSTSTAENPRFYFNEVNTLPGFTSISMFPQLWEVSGIPYAELLTKLIELALKRSGPPFGDGAAL